VPVIRFILVGIFTSLAVMSTGTVALATNAAFIAEPTAIACAMNDGPASLGGISVSCQSADTSARHSAILASDGKVVICAERPITVAGRCEIANSALKNAPTAQAGTQINVGRFRCLVLTTGVECTVVSTGQGFLITEDNVVRIGHPSANRRPSTAPLWAALGGKVICGLAIHSPGTPSELLCFARPVPAPVHTRASEGDPGYVFLRSVGHSRLARLSQYSWAREGGYESKHRAALAAGQKWSGGALKVTCTISPNAVRCVNRSNHGYVITKSSYRMF
jgi:hypothetical protein